MRIIVTGATGFLGSYVVGELLRGGHAVAVVARRPGDAWRLREWLGDVQTIPGTLADLEALRASFVAFKPDAVAHLAWAGVGGASHNSPAQARNIPMTVELAALAAETGAAVFVGTGSQAEYGAYPRIVREDDAPRPTTLYGHAKLAAGTLAAQVAAKRKLRFAWLRVFSTYGPKDNPDWLIPSMIVRLQNRERMSLTKCEQRWGFLHAADAAAAYHVVIEKERAVGVFNLGSPDAPSLRDTVTLLRDLVDPAAELGFGEVQYRSDQVMHLQADITRLAGLGWQPQVDLEAGLRETADWFLTQRPSVDAPRQGSC